MRYSLVLDSIGQALAKRLDAHYNGHGLLVEGKGVVSTAINGQMQYIGIHDRLPNAAAFYIRIAGDFQHSSLKIGRVTHSVPCVVVLYALNGQVAALHDRMLQALMTPMEPVEIDGYRSKVELTLLSSTVDAIAVMEAEMDKPATNSSLRLVAAQIEISWQTLSRCR